MCQCGNLRVVCQPRFTEEIVGYGFGSRRCEECAHVYAHVEYAVCQVAFAAVARVVVKVAHKRLEISLEHTCSGGYEHQCAEHHYFCRQVGACRYCQYEITGEHYGDTEYHCFAVPQNPVGQNTAEYGQEIYQGQESAEDCAGAVGTEAEFGLHEQHENSQHGIVAETLAHVGYRKHE